MNGATMPPRPAYRRTLWIVRALLAAGLVASGARPYDRATWLREVLPVLLGRPLLWLTARRFPLTTLLAACIVVHGAVLMLGGAYTYARVPLGFALQEAFGLARNPYDKIGHFMQGFVPALAAREILLRGRYVRGRRMLAFIVVCIVLAVSAAYELVEWAVALALGQGADDFLGTQGDPWDTQEDMAFALVGALASLAILARRHDRQLAALGAQESTPEGRDALSAGPCSSRRTSSSPASR
jgi:putative membrane protein